MIKPAVLAELEQLSAVDTAEGQVALRLAEALDGGKGVMAFAALGKELRATLDELRDRVPRAEDGVDEFAARRAARRAAAGFATAADPVPSAGGHDIR